MCLSHVCIPTQSSTYFKFLYLGVCCMYARRNGSFHFHFTWLTQSRTARALVSMRQRCKGSLLCAHCYRDRILLFLRSLPPAFPPFFLNFLKAQTSGAEKFCFPRSRLLTLSESVASKEAARLTEDKIRQIINQPTVFTLGSALSIVSVAINLISVSFRCVPQAGSSCEIFADAAAVSVSRRSSRLRGRIASILGLGGLLTRSSKQAFPSRMLWFSSWDRWTMKRFGFI